MSHMEQGRAGVGATARGRSRLGAVSRRAAGYFGADPPLRDDDTAEFVFDGSEPVGVRAATVVLPLTRSGGYERSAVEAKLAELEEELSFAQAVAAAPTGVEAEIRRLGDETAEIMRVAHQQASDLVTRATAEAAQLRASAHAEAAAATAASEARLRELDRETDQIWAERTRLADDTLRLAQALQELGQGALERFPAAGGTDELGPVGLLQLADEADPLGPQARIMSSPAPAPPAAPAPLEG